MIKSENLPLAIEAKANQFYMPFIDMAKRSQIGFKSFGLKQLSQTCRDTLAVIYYSLSDGVLKGQHDPSNRLHKSLVNTAYNAICGGIVSFFDFASQEVRGRIMSFDLLDPASYLCNTSDIRVGKMRG